MCMARDALFLATHTVKQKKYAYAHVRTCMRMAVHFFDRLMPALESSQLSDHRTRRRGQLVRS